MSKSPSTIVIDPGASTGVAVFEGEKLLSSFTSKPPFDELWLLLAEWAKSDVPINLVCEQPPANPRHQSETTDLHKQLELAGCHFVRPSEWKGHPQAKLLDGDTPGTIHERDVIRLGRYWLHKHRRDAQDQVA